MLIVIASAVVIVILTVGIHLVALNAITNVLHRLKEIRHYHIGLAVLGALVAHLVEIWVFSVAIRLLLLHANVGHLRNEIEFEHRDLFYLSATVYTSLGPETAPVGDIRIFFAVEVVTGLVLITWTASYLFLIMQRNWEQRHRE